MKISKNNYEIITFAHYFRSFTCQPFYIWNTENNLSENELIPAVDANGFLLYNQNSRTINNFKSLELLLEDEDEILEGGSFNNLSEYFESLFEQNENYNQIPDYMHKLFNDATNQMQDFLLNEVLEVNKNEIFFNKINPLETDLQDINTLYISNTLQALKNPNIKVIFNPTFAYHIKKYNDIDFFAKTSFLLFDKENKTVYFNALNARTTIKEYFKANYIYEVVNKYLEINHLEQFKIKKIKFVYFDKRNVNHFSNKLNFKIAEAACANKDGQNKNEEIADGSFFVKKGFDFINVIKQKQIFNNPDARYLDKWVGYNHEKDDRNIPQFNDLKDLIIESYFIEKPSYSKNNEFNLEQDFHKEFGRNELTKKIVFKNLDYDHQYSTGICKMLGVINQEYINKFKELVDNKKTYPNGFNSNLVSYLSNYFKKDKRYIWYDYEGFSGVAPLFPSLKPYQQITNQVSIIETINGIEVYKTNIVKDPLNIELIDIVDNILAVYSNKADYYIVFNKTYENSRNKEIANVVAQRYANNDQNFINQMEQRNLDNNDFQFIVNHINNNTLDLLDAFKKIKNEDIDTEDFFVESNVFEPRKDHQQIMDKVDKFTSSIGTYINIFELLGFTSIKKIEKLITANKVELEHKIKEYSSLDQVHNGLEAMKYATIRYLGALGDNEWNSIQENLKIYCENDVRAMIMTFDFIVLLVANVVPEINELKYKIDENEKMRLIKNNNSELKITLIRN